MKKMPIKTQRTLISTVEAAKILDVSQGRVRQLVLPGPKGQAPKLWSDHLGPKIIVLDKREVEKLAKEMQRRRDEGRVCGPKPLGFKPDRPGVYRRQVG
jgi:hypothetical protein